jgi:hypothetical protein
MMAGWGAAVMAEAEPQFLRTQAMRFRRLAREIVDEHGRQVLIALAEEYETSAAEVEAGGSDRSSGTAQPNGK